MNLHASTFALALLFLTSPSIGTLFNAPSPPAERATDQSEDFRLTYKQTIWANGLNTGTSTFQYFFTSFTPPPVSPTLSSSSPSQRTHDLHALAQTLWASANGQQGQTIKPSNNGILNFPSVGSAHVRVVKTHHRPFYWEMLGNIAELILQGDAKVSQSAGFQVTIVAVGPRGVLEGAPRGYVQVAFSDDDGHREGDGQFVFPELERWEEVREGF